MLQIIVLKNGASRKADKLRVFDGAGIAVVSSVDAAALVADCQGDAADAVAGYENASLKPLIYRS